MLRKAKRPAPKDASGKVLPTVPETVLKRRKRRDEAQIKKLKAHAIQKAKLRLKKKVVFKRAEIYQAEYMKMQSQERRLKRRAQAKGDYYVPAQANLAFVIRIRGINKVSPKVRKTLQLFRLRQINNGVFVQLNKATVNMLQACQPYITWGYPSLKTVRDLIYKRGFAKIHNQRIPITSNEVVERGLRVRNIICMEDLVHEIFTTGKMFKYASNYLWPFKLNTPTGGWRRKNNHYVDGGDFGNREGKINDLLQKMI